MIVIVILGCAFTAMVFLSLTLFPPGDEERRPRLRPFIEEEKRDAKSSQKILGVMRFMIRQVALINRPLCVGPLERRIKRDLLMGRVEMIPEEFFLIKEALAIGLFLGLYSLMNDETMTFWMLTIFGVSYYGPEFWLRKKIATTKDTIIKELPDAIDLLALCVNAGLDFMLALKWVIEKSRKTVLTDELNLIMQEINVGKARRTSLSDLAKKYNIPDLSTFSRTLIQADRMGTSVAEAFNILSEDMRLARYRRGEQIALKAPMKILVPLLFFIFPVVGILVAAPIFLEFLKNNPVNSIQGGMNVGGSAKAPGL